MTHTLIPRKCDAIIFDVLHKYYVTVFGGYIRDLFLGETPKDIDCVVEKKYFDSLNGELIKLGYERHFIDDDIYGYEHNDSLIPLDVCIDDTFSHETTYISPLSYPDVDVNNMYWYWNNDSQMYELDLWAPGDDLNIDEIVMRLKNKIKIAYKYPSCTEERLMKIKSKFFEVHNSKTEQI